MRLGSTSSTKPMSLAESGRTRSQDAALDPQGTIVVAVVESDARRTEHRGAASSPPHIRLENPDQVACWQPVTINPQEPTSPSVTPLLTETSRKSLIVRRVRTSFTVSGRAIRWRPLPAKANVLVLTSLTVIELLGTPTSRLGVDSGERIDGHGSEPFGATTRSTFPCGFEYSARESSSDPHELPTSESGGPRSKTRGRRGRQVDLRDAAYPESEVFRDDRDQASETMAEPDRCGISRRKRRRAPSCDRQSIRQPPSRRRDVRLSSVASGSSR